MRLSTETLRSVPVAQQQSLKHGNHGDDDIAFGFGQEQTHLSLAWEDDEKPGGSSVRALEPALAARSMDMMDMSPASRAGRVQRENAWSLEFRLGFQPLGSRNAKFRYNMAVYEQRLAASLIVTLAQRENPGNIKAPYASQTGRQKWRSFVGDSLDT